MYLPVLAIGVQGEAHLTRSHGPAAGLKVHNFRYHYCTPRGAQVRLFSLRSTDDVISPERGSRGTTAELLSAWSTSRRAEIAVYSETRKESFAG